MVPVYGLSTTAQEHVATASRIAAEIASPNAANVDLRARFPTESIKALGLIARGKFSIPVQYTTDKSRLTPREGRLTTSDMLKLSPLPFSADPFTDFAPRGAGVEPGGPGYPFTLNEREHVAPRGCQALRSGC